jgi:hypothetical protein
MIKHLNNSANRKTYKPKDKRRRKKKNNKLPSRHKRPPAVTTPTFADAAGAVERRSSW